MDKEIIIDHSKLTDPQTITPITKRIFKEHGLDTKIHEVVGLEDDGEGDGCQKGKRIVKVRVRKYFDMKSRG